MCPGLTQSTRGDVLYMWIYIYISTFSFLIPPQNWIYLRLPLLHCDSWHIGEEFFRPAQRHTWISEQRSVGSLEDEHPPPQYKRMKRENELGAISGVMYSKNHHAHTHTLEHNRVSATSECQHKRLRKGNNPASGSDLEWMKIRLERFSNLCLFEQIGALRIPTSDSPSHIIHFSGSRTRCGITNYWEKTQNKVLLSHKYRTRELPLISLNLELYYGCSLISERRGIRIFIILW